MKKLVLIMTLAVFGLLTIASGPPDTTDDLPVSPHTFESQQSLIEDITKYLGLADSGGYVCTVYASDPYKTNQDINGNGWVICNGDFVSVRLTVAVQRHLFLRWWKTLASVRTPFTTSGYATDTVFAYCVNGTHAYRIVSTAEVIENDGGSVLYRVKSEDELRTPCP